MLLFALGTHTSQSESLPVAAFLCKHAQMISSCSSEENCLDNVIFTYLTGKEVPAKLCRFFFSNPTVFYNGKNTVSLPGLSTL